MSSTNKLLVLLSPFLFLLFGVMLFLDGTQTAVADTPNSAPIVKTIAPQPIQPFLANQAVSTQQACSSPVKVMPFGDSITLGEDSSHNAGYRLPLYLSLRNAGFDVQFVGSQNNGPATGFDPYHAGFAGYEISAFVGPFDYMLQNKNNQPDAVLIHLGTNDMSNNKNITNTLIPQLESLLIDIDEYENDTQKTVQVFLAKIISQACNPLTLNCAKTLNRTELFNQQIDTLAATRIGNGDSLVVVDMFDDAGLINAVTPTGDFSTDKIHPVDSGYDKMAATWFDAMSASLTNNCNTPPLIIENAVLSATINNRYAYQMVSSGITPLNYSLTSAPDGMTIDPQTGMINWHPSVIQEGVHSVTAVVTNSGGSDSYTFDIDVTNAGIAVIQEPHQATLLSGSSLQFSVDITNTSATTLTSVTVDFPQTPACNPADLAPISPGDSQSITCDVTNILADLTHTVFVTGTNEALEQFSASDVSTIDIINPQLAIDKSTSTPIVLYDGTAEFSVIITNTGDVDLSDVVVTDPDAPGCNQPALGTLTVGQQVTYTCSLPNVTADLVNSTITVSGTHQLGQSTASDTVDINVINPVIDLGVDPHDQAILSGGDAFFTVEITNTGDVNLANVILSHPHVSCNRTDFGSLFKGQKKSTTCSSLGVTADFFNSMTVTGDHVLGQVTDDEYAIVDVFSDQVEIVKTAASTALAGSTVDFTITVTNTSGTDISNVIIHDPLAGFSMTLTTLAEDDSHTEIVSIANAQVNLTNTSFVTATLPNMTTASSSDLAIVDIIDPGIDMTISPATQEINVNETAQITITVENTGDVPLTNVTVTMDGVSDCTRSLDTIADQADSQFTCEIEGITDDVSKTAVVTGNHVLGTVSAQDTAVIILDQSFIFLPLVIR